MRGWGGKPITTMTDEFRTPGWLVDACLDQLGPYIEPQDVLLDPAAGNGVWGNKMRLMFLDCQVNECEITLGSDFYDVTYEYDWIIGNPPFSKLTQWLSHTGSIAGKGFGYLLPVHALSANRLDMLAEWGFYLDKMHIIVNPLEWQLGYPHAFCIFTRKGQMHVLGGLVTDTKQTRLTDLCGND